MNYLLLLAYDGTNYCGYQVQKNGRSIAETLQNAMEAILGFRPDIKGCSRTDSGVHAEEFALNFRLETPLKFAVSKLPLALNAKLPEDIRVFCAKEVSEDFHARYSSKGKTYEYRIRNSSVNSPFYDKYETRVTKPLCIAEMQKAAQLFVGTHDCIALCSAGSSAAANGDTVRTITQCDVLQKGENVIIRITANGYLYNMVRIIAGTLVEVGLGKRKALSIPDILTSKDRTKAGNTMAAKGLFLCKVHY